MDQLIIPKLIFFFVLITSLIDIVLISKREILSWSLMGVQGLLNNNFKLVNIVIIVKNIFMLLFRYPRRNSTHLECVQKLSFDQH